MHPERCYIRILVSQIGNDKPAECAQKRTQEIRLRIAIPSEHIRILGPGEQLEDLVQLGCPEEQARVVHEAEHEHGDSAHCDALHCLVERIQPPVETALFRPLALHVHLLAADSSSA